MKNHILMLATLLSTNLFASNLTYTFKMQTDAKDNSIKITNPRVQLNGSSYHLDYASYGKKNDKDGLIRMCNSLGYLKLNERELEGIYRKSQMDNYKEFYSLREDKLINAEKNPHGDTHPTNNFLYALTEMGCSYSGKKGLANSNQLLQLNLDSREFSALSTSTGKIQEKIFYKPYLKFNDKKYFFHPATPKETVCKLLGFNEVVKYDYATLNRFGRIIEVNDQRQIKDAFKTSINNGNIVGDFHINSISCWDKIEVSEVPIKQNTKKPEDQTTDEVDDLDNF